MSLISDVNLKSDENSISFKINNPKDKAKYEIALINGIRRTILVDISSFAINREQVKFYKNTSVFNNDFITLRLALLSIMHKNIEDKDLEELEFQIVKDNKSDDIIEVTPNDFKITYKEEEINPNEIFAFPDSIICKLKPYQDINFKCFLSKGNHKDNGSYFCPVSKATYFFEMDNAELEKEVNNKKAAGELENDEEEIKKFRMIKRERCYKKTNDDKPLTYCFGIESTGELPAERIFVIGCELFRNRCENLIAKLKDDPNEEKVTINSSPTNLRAFDFMFFDENDTIGNLLQVYLYFDKDVEYSGYEIPHPLDNKLVVRLALKKKDFTEEDCVKKVIESLETIVKQIDEIKSSYLEKVKLS